MKKWWFSIFCWLVALGLQLYIVLDYFINGLSDDYITSLLMISCLSPILLLIIIGVANQPRKGE